MQDLICPANALDVDVQEALETGECGADFQETFPVIRVWKIGDVEL